MEYLEEIYDVKRYAFILFENNLVKIITFSFFSL